MSKIKWIGIVRIVGLCLVLTYHFFIQKLPGGFIGVDVFFTFSGYLITALAVSEARRKGGYSLGSFFKRRVLRICPPFIFSVILVLPFTLLVSPDFRAGLTRQIGAALGFVTNYYEIQTGGSYEARLLPHLFVHTWSLAVEVQLYILWAFVCKFLSAAAAGKERMLKWLFFIISVELAAASYLYMQIAYGSGMEEPSFVYFNTLTRAYPFFIGSAAGALLGVDISEKTRQTLKKAASVLRVRVIGTVCAISAIAALVLLASGLTFTSAATYRFGILLASVFTVILIVSLRLLHEATPDDICEPAIVSGLSDMSYCIFLVHWPLFVVFSDVRAFSSELSVFAAAMALTLLFSYFIHYRAEPFIQKKHRNVNGSMRFAYASFTIVFFSAFALSAHTVLSAPSVSSLESEMNVGYMYQDADKLRDTKRMSDAVNEQTLFFAFEDPVHAFIYWDFDSHAVLSAVVGQDTGGAISVPSARPPGRENAEGEPVEDTMPESNIETDAQEAETHETEITVTPQIPPRPVVIRPDRELNAEGIPKGVFIIGDSVCLGARQTLIETIPDCDVDSAQNRQMWQGHELLLELQEDGLLPEYVVIALGTNVNHNALDRVDAIIRDINPGHRLIFVTPYNGKVAKDSLTNQTAEHIRTLPELYPFVTVADWAGIIGPQDHIIGADRCHIGGNRNAVRIYVEIIEEALAEAAEKPAAGEETPETEDIAANGSQIETEQQDAKNDV